MDPSAKSFFLKSCKTYPHAKCHLCKHKTNRAMLVSFRFKRGTHEFWNTRHDTKPPREKFTIRDWHLVCQTCGFKNKASMEGHTYTWIDGSVTYCPLKQSKKYKKWIFDSIKTLKQQVKELQDELQRKKSDTVCL